jgi:hypothetical protein
MLESHYENNSRLFFKCFQILWIILFYIYIIIHSIPQNNPLRQVFQKLFLKMNSSKNPWFSNYTKKKNFPFILNYYIIYVCHTTLNILSIFSIFCHTCLII